MRRILSVTLTVFLSISIVMYSTNTVNSAENPSQPLGDSSWNLVFSDEFEGSRLDTSKWSYNYPWGNTHNHRAYCVAENVTISDGLLRIKGENKRHPSAPDGVEQGGEWHSLDYTAGAINTKNKFNFTTGYIEGSFKLPSTKGFWPAFWTLNADGAWPPEIDILEVLCHAPNELHTNYHYGPSWDNKWSHYQKFPTDNLSQNFHTYAVEWTPEYMKWYLDGKQIGSTFKDAKWIAQSKEMYLLINLAIGGWEDNPDKTSQWPSYYECDWVRVWQKGNTPTKTPTLTPTPTEAEVVIVGDLNGDRQVNSTDYTLLRRYILGIAIDTPSYFLSAADVDRSGSINSTDYSMLRRYILGVINKL